MQPCSLISELMPALGRDSLGQSRQIGIQLGPRSLLRRPCGRDHVRSLGDGGDGLWVGRAPSAGGAGSVALARRHDQQSSQRNGCKQHRSHQSFLCATSIKQRRAFAVARNQDGPRTNKGRAGAFQGYFRARLFLRLFLQAECHDMGVMGDDKNFAQRHHRFAEMHPIAHGLAAGP